MKKTIAVCGITIDAYAQPYPPHPACNTPNPPPWCDNPPVPMDDWQLILVAFLIGIMIGYLSLNKTFNTKDDTSKGIN